VSDDLLKPEEIEALLKAAGAASTPVERGPTGRTSGPSSSGARGQEVDAVDAALTNAVRQSTPGAAAGASRGQKPKSPTERLLEQAEAGLAAAIASNVQSQTRGGIPAELGQPSPFQLQSLDAAGGSGGDGVGLNALQDVELDLRIELGRTELLIEEVLQLKEGSVVPLNKLAGDPVDILVNGRLVARGEVLVLNDNFCVRVAEIVAPTL
jgi:flagellar motor switch protein FliN